MPSSRQGPTADLTVGDLAADVVFQGVCVQRTSLPRTCFFAVMVLGRARLFRVKQVEAV